MTSATDSELTPHDQMLRDLVHHRAFAREVQGRLLGIQCACGAASMSVDPETHACKRGIHYDLNKIYWYASKVMLGEY